MEKKATKKYEGITIYGKGDSALSISPLQHKRKKDDSGEEVLKGYKINITSTVDLFKTKNAVYLENEELLDLILVLRGLKNEAKFIRGGNKDGSKIKSIMISNYNGKVYIKYDEKDPKQKTSFLINNLNIIILNKMIMRQLIKEIPFLSGIKMTEKDIIDGIEYLLKNRLTQVDINNKTNIGKQDSLNNDGFLISYINTYNNKDFENKINVDEKVYNFIKEQKHLNLNENKKSDFIKKIKELDEENAKFLNEKNFKTLKAK